MKFFVIGFSLSLLGILISFFVWGIGKIYYGTGIIGLVFLGLCIIFSGSLADGDRMRANFTTETTKDRLNRDRFVTKSLLIAIPNLVVSLILYFFVK